MNWNKVTFWFRQGILDPNIASKATKKRHKHQHNPTWLPPTAMAPSLWKKLRRAKAKKANSKKSRR